MSRTWLTFIHGLILFVGPIFFLGLIQRTKAICAGRKGPKLYQTMFDLLRLLRKKPVYSTSTSWIFQMAPSIVLSSTVIAGFFAPIFPGFSLLSFPGDFVAFAYVLGLGRMFLVLAALDTGSSFEGMGASREMTFSSLIEPAFFLGVGTLASLSGKTTFHDLLPLTSNIPPLLLALVVLMLFITLQTEAARVPVDDPATHLELTMVHEVMILDHSGPDLAVMTYGASVKMTIWLGIIAAVTNPLSINDYGIFSVILSLLLMGVFSMVVGFFESVMARLRMSTVSHYTLGALGASGVMFILLICKTI